MKNLICCLCILSLMSFTVWGQKIEGYIYDAKTNEPLVGVNVTYQFKGETRGVASDVNGFYEVTVPTGGIELTFSFVGYTSQMLPLVVNPRGVIKKDVYLKMEAHLLEDVVISAGRFEQKVSDLTVSMDVLKADAILRQDPSDITATLKTIPGVDINDKQPSIRGGSGWTYGVGARSLILVDGMSVLTPGSGEINWNTIPMENIAQVEVLKGASSVLYGSSALNGVIHIRTARPGLVPKTNLNAYLGIYGDPENSNYLWWDKGFWKEGKYPVEPFLRKNVFSGIRNPIYEGIDFSHARRIGNFDVSGGINIFSDEGYRQGDFNRRVRVGGNVTYHQPGKNMINYGASVHFLSNKYGDFFIWRSPSQAYRPSPFTNMGREGNQFQLAPFYNFTNPDKNVSHKIRGRFFYRADNIIQTIEPATLPDILSNMGTDVNKLAGFISEIQSGDWTKYLKPIIGPALTGNWQGVVDGLVDEAGKLLPGIFPHATTADYCDLIAWGMNALKDLETGKMNSIPNGENLIPWLNNALNPADPKVYTDKFYNYYLDYQFNKRWGNAQLTAGLTYERMRATSRTTGDHDSDNAAVFVQFDDKFFDRLNISLGVRGEYYRVDDHKREAETKIFGYKVPFQPVFRGGLSYKLADYSFIRASFGQGYRYPSLTEKYARKDIGGVGVYPSPDLKAEKGFNAEAGFKQGYKFGGLQGFIDIAGFYTEYKNMIEFRFGLFDNGNNSMLNSMNDVLKMIIAQNSLGIGAQFYNVSKARIYGAEISTTGVYAIHPNAWLTYNLGYVFIQPEDADYQEKNAREATYTDPLQMKEKSNTSRYLKYRQKHTFKASFDFEWKRLSLGTNLQWKSKTLAVDYIMLDERVKENKELMDYVRGILFGTERDGYNMADYWKEHNKSYFIMDIRAGVKVTQNVQFQFLINNLLNKEYSVRPMAVAAPRTFVMKMGLNF